MNVDTSGVVKLWRPGRDIATYPTSIAADGTYHLRVRTAGSRIQVWLNHGATPVIDATDDVYPAGRFGANVYQGSATVQNLNTGPAGFTSFTSGPWTAAGGTWTTTPDGLHASSAGDGFYLSDRTGTDFTYEGDVSVTNGKAAGLTFRATADGTGYTANIDTSGVVKLWRPGLDIATHATPIIEGRTYHLKVQTAGSRIRVWLGPTWSSTRPTPLTPPGGSGSTPTPGTRRPRTSRSPDRPDSPVLVRVRPPRGRARGPASPAVATRT